MVEQRQAQRMTREEAVKYLTMQRDWMDEAVTKERTIEILSETGKAIGYAPAFRCLVIGLDPEDSIRWGK